MSTELVQFEGLKAELTQLVSPTLALKVTDFPSSTSAIEAAKAVKSLQKRVEARRKELVGPLNEQVKLINEYVKGITIPLEEAEAHLKKQLAAFEVEQERIRQEELRRAEEERKRLEAELLAKQEAERARVTEQAEAADIFGSDPEETPAAQESAVLEQKQLAELAQLSQAHKEREYEIKQKGIKNARKTWKCEAVDLSLVPKEFLIISLNQAAVLAAARGGMTNIPGVRLWQETTVAIGSNTYVPSGTRSFQP